MKDPWVALTSGVGLLLYGVLRTAYSVFYAKLGLKPEDVGFGYAEILSQTVAGMSLVLVIFLALSLLLVFTYGLVVTGLTAMSSDLAKTSHGPPTRRARVVALALLVGGTAALSWLVFLAPVPLRSRAGDIFPYLVFAVFFVRGIRYSLLVGWRPLVEGYRPWILGAMGFSVLLVLTLYFLAPALDGAAVREGRAVSAAFGPLPIASWGASYASVAWTEEPVAGFPSACLMYLGEANGKAVFFDVIGQRSLRVPVSGLSVFVDVGKLRDASCVPNDSTSQATESQEEAGG